jgi:phage-related protein
MSGIYEHRKGIYRTMTAFLKSMIGFYEYAKGIHQNMTAFLKNRTGFHKLYCTVPAAVRHITQTARPKHNQSLREEPSSPSRWYKTAMTFVPSMIIRWQAN